MWNKIFGNPKNVLLIVLSIATFAFLIDLPRIPINFSYKQFEIDTEIGGYSLSLFGGAFQRDLEIKKGLDISGGVSVLMEADMSNISDVDKVQALNSLRNVIERRVNLLGISEANVQTSKVGESYRVIVELAGVFDAEQALSTIGQVAQLEFKVPVDETTVDEEAPEEELSEEAEEATEQPTVEEQLGLPKFEPSGLTGADLRKAVAVVGSTQSGLEANQPQVQLQFNTEGTKKFREITQNNIGQPVAIYLDDQLVMAPTVQSAITDGQAVITGGFTMEQATQLATQLNAGALPVPVNIVKQQTIGPTLGQESVEKSIIAGGVGLALVIGFMILYYGRLGILASIALVIYGLVTLALYKLIPVVLTLPGLAGFILSIGMAVDANILIFERIKEELRAGKPLAIALENGFGRSWDSIRDANVATLLTAFILFNPFDWGFLPASGPVRGFALTLALGIFISLFTGVFITRNLVRVFYHGLSKKKENTND